MGGNKISSTFGYIFTRTRTIERRQKGYPQTCITQSHDSFFFRLEQNDENLFQVVHTSISPNNNQFWHLKMLFQTIS